jgi:DNA-binding GntR family transcriptional regulator
VATEPSSLLRLEALSLRERAADAIRNGIVTGEIRGGELYSVPTLAARLGVSATPVREAMLDLANEGLVEAVRNRGFRVLELSDDDLDEILEVRIMLEVPAAGRLARGLPVEAEPRLSALVEETEERARSSDVEGFLTADRAFHLALVDLAGNRRLVDLVARLRDQTRLYGLPELLASGILETAAADHRAILAAIVAGDAGQAESRMRSHLEQTTRGVWTGDRGYA